MASSTACESKTTVLCSVVRNSTKRPVVTKSYGRTKKNSPQKAQKLGKEYHDRLTDVKVYSKDKWIDLGRIEKESCTQRPI